MNAPPLSPEEAIELLGARLYWKAEQIDPGDEDLPWEELPEGVREFHRSLARDIVACSDWIEAAQTFPAMT